MLTSWRFPNLKECQRFSKTWALTGHAWWTLWSSWCFWRRCCWVQLTWEFRCLWCIQNLWKKVQQTKITERKLLQNVERKLSCFLQKRLQEMLHNFYLMIIKHSSAENNSNKDVPPRKEPSVTSAEVCLHWGDEAFVAAWVLCVSSKKRKSVDVMVHATWIWRWELPKWKTEL